MSHHGGHLARLSVHPDFQRTGIGYNLVQDILVRFKSQGASKVTVNTQVNNHSSLALYEKFGFQKTSEIFPTYQYSIISNQYKQV
jgi:ribosomal protein S18 acetylase RimI-like enzyme